MGNDGFAEAGVIPTQITYRTSKAFLRLLYPLRHVCSCDSFTLRRAIPRRATRTIMHLDSVSAELRDRLRCIIGSLQTAWMMGGPEEQRSRPFALASWGWLWWGHGVLGLRVAGSTGQWFV